MIFIMILYYTTTVLLTSVRKFTWMKVATWHRFDIQFFQASGCH